MYCKKCHALLDENNLICPKCNFDNEHTIIVKNKKDLQNLDNELKEEKIEKSYIIPTLLVFAVIAVAGIVIYSFNDTKGELAETPTTTTELVYYETETNEFTFNKIQLSYSSSFGSATSTIFYINNAAINITFVNIDSEEYQHTLETNDCLDSKIGEISTKTFATDNSYSHLFMLNDEYYKVTVNYTNTNELTESITNEINKILNTTKEVK